MVSHLPAMLPVAVGCALAFRMRGEPRVALGWFGDGGSARGDAHEAMNLAGVRRLPVVFVLDNNGFAYSTPAHLEYGVTHLAERAAAYGFPGVVVDGTDVVAVYRAAQTAIERARTGGGPTLLELVTLRMEGHAVHDDAFYVPPELLAAWRERDPLALLRARLLAAGGAFDEAADEALRSEVAREVDVAVELALASPWPDPATLTTASTAEPPGAEARDGGPDYDDDSEGPVAVRTYLEAISDGLREEMRRDDRVLRDRRGRRRLRRRVQGHEGLPGGVRASGA